MALIDDAEQKKKSVYIWHLQFSQSLHLWQRSQPFQLARAYTIQHGASVSVHLQEVVAIPGRGGGREGGRYACAFTCTCAPST